MRDEQTYFLWVPGIEIVHLGNDDEGEEYDQNTYDTTPLETIVIEETHFKD